MAPETFHESSNRRSRLMSGTVADASFAYASFADASPADASFADVSAGVGGLARVTSPHSSRAPAPQSREH